MSQKEVFFSGENDKLQILSHNFSNGNSFFCNLINVSTEKLRSLEPEIACGLAPGVCKVVLEALFFLPLFPRMFLHDVFP